jgi:hypothetical protein
MGGLIKDSGPSRIREMEIEVITIEEWCEDDRRMA